MIVLGLYILFTISYFLHLPSRFPILGTLRMEVFLGSAILAYSFITGRLGQVWGSRSPALHRLAWLVGFIVLSIPFVTWPGSVIRVNLVEYFKVVFFFLITAAIIDSEKRLKLFLSVFIGCQMFRILEPLYLHLTTGYWGDVAYSYIGDEITSLNRLAGAPHDVVNANQFAWVIVSAVPFVYYLGLRSRNIILAGLSLPAIGAMGYALIQTGSRSGMVSLAVVIIWIAWLGPGRLRRIVYMTIVLLPLVTVGIGKMDTNMLTRYLSLVDHSVVGGDTAVGRIEGVKRNLETVSLNPVFGNGIGTSRETNYNIHGGFGQLTHSLYVEALQEIGIIGFVLFLIYIYAVSKTLLNTYNVIDETRSPFLTRLVQATLVWFFMDIVYSFSCFGLSSWEWYLFGGIANVCWVLSQNHIYSGQEKRPRLYPDVKVRA